MKPASSARTSPGRPWQVVLTGNPNCGKTTLFNALTGLRARVGNYAGVTVERKEGSLQGVPTDGPAVSILDLPGTYSLSPQSMDEQIARDVLFGRIAEVPPPDCVLVVIDASNLQRNLYFATQVIELGHPTAIVLNMVDVAEANGQQVDPTSLAKALGTPVFPLVASEGVGLDALREFLIASAAKRNPPDSPSRSFAELPETFGREASRLSELLDSAFPNQHHAAAAEALLLLSDDKVLEGHPDHYPDSIRTAIGEARTRLESAGVDWRSAAIEARYARAMAIQMAVTTETAPPGETLSDRLDRVLTHRTWGLAIFVLIMALMFQSIFTIAEIPKGWIEWAVDGLARGFRSAIPPGEFNSLVTHGIIQGVGAVLAFLPQICLLFLFISLLEDTGYMARAAFLMDRLMSKVGLHGKSFIPLLSSFACAIPGIMATRTIESPKDRLATMLVAPLMSCSARLPVYALLTAACIPPLRIAGLDISRSLTLLVMYFLGIVSALGMAWLFKRTFLKGEPPPLILELPPYKRPVVKVVLHHMWERSKLFLRRAGTVILAINILLWFLATYPKSEARRLSQSAELAALLHPEMSAADRTQKLQANPGWALAELQSQTAIWTSTNLPPAVAQLRDQADAWKTRTAGENLRASYAGTLGRLIEPIIRPLGFDWKIGIGIVASFAAREVFVSTMSVVYNVSGDAEDASALAGILQREKSDAGTPQYTFVVGASLMVFYVFAMQCVSTLAVMRRETNSWKWPLFQFAYMTALAWIAAWICRHLLMALGFQ